MLLSGVSRANTEYVRSDVWHCVEPYVICTTPCVQAKDHFQIES
jgi:hypothetical protein